jgi:DNA polymerase-4
MQEPPRIIAHLDMDAFFASVELLRYPELRGVPVVVGGGRRHQPEEIVDPVTGAMTRRFATLGGYVGRGVATTASYEARVFGINSAMGLMKAAKLAPQAILLPSDFDAYREQSHRFKAAVRGIAPEVEDRGIDEIYIDLTEVVAPLASSNDGFDRSAITQVARAIKTAVNQATGLSCSIGIAPNKLLAKIASDLEKPDGLVIIEASDVPTRIWPLAAKKINGIGPKATAKLIEMGITTIGELAAADLSTLGDRFGVNSAKWMHEVAHGRDRRGVSTYSETKSISRETTFERDLHAVRDRAALSEIFTYLCDKLADDLQRKGYVARNIGLKLRYDDFTIATRATTLAIPTQDAKVIRRIAGECARRAPLERRIRLLGVRAGTLMRADEAAALSNEDQRRRSGDLFDVPGDEPHDAGQGRVDVVNLG